jgi:DNA-binding CsgD family transcriptional regulator
MNSQLDILAHPNKELWGKNMTDFSSSFIPIAEDLKQGIPVLEHRIINYKGEASVAFSRELEKGWFIAVIIPENIYFREMRIMRLVIVIAGTILAALFIMLVQLLYNAQKKLKHYGVSKLTAREMEIFNLLLTDMPIKQIAEKTALTNAGVNFHIQNLYRKLGIQSRTELFAKFVNKPDSV